MTETAESVTKNIKLSTGVELIADIVSFNEGMLMIHKPIIVNYRYFQNTAFPMISFVKYMILSNEENYVFSVKDIMNISEPLAVMVDYYKATVDNVYEHSNSLLQGELTKALDGINEENSKKDLYDAILGNFQSDTVN